MAKHPHRLMLMQKKTWKCTLEGCAFFVHVGLAHVLLGKQSICWECGEQFTLDEDALKETMPKCVTHRAGVENEIQNQIDELERKLAAARYARSEEQGMTTMERLLKRARENAAAAEAALVEEDQIEVIEADEIEHAADCDIWNNEECSCKV